MTASLNRTTASSTKLDKLLALALHQTTPPEEALCAFNAARRLAQSETAILPSNASLIAKVFLVDRVPYALIPSVNDLVVDISQRFDVSVTTRFTDTFLRKYEFPIFMTVEGAFKGHQADVERAHEVLLHEATILLGEKNIKKPLFSRLSRGIRAYAVKAHEAFSTLTNKRA